MPAARPKALRSTSPAAKNAAVAKQIADKVGQVSILVNNAGIVRRNAFGLVPRP